MSVWQRAPLSLRLVTGLLALAAVALAVSGFAGGRLLRGYLQEQVDDELRKIATPERIQDELVGGTPTHYDIAKLDASGDVTGAIPSSLGEGVPDFSDITVNETIEHDREPFTVGAAAGDGRWRVLALPYSDHRGSLVIARSLDEVDGTVSRLRTINLLVGLAVLLGLAIAAAMTVRSALRPLREIEQTAGAITGGDMTQRVADTDPGTEVGRVGLALNTMLDQIEAAFRDRAESETTARRSESRMRQFVADASHELRTPLTSIRGFAELYRQGALTDPSAVPDLLRRIEDEAIRMGLLVDDLLLLARLDQERPLAEEPLDLGVLVKESVEATRAVAPDRKVELTATLDPIVIGDATRLRHVIANLLDNAVRHTPSGTPVDVSLSRVTVDGRDWAQVEVRDHGAGLTKDQAERVFERFYRTDAARTRSQGGSGLGLSIVAAIVAAHQGRALVDSTPGEGSAFQVLLPLPAASAPPSDSGD